MVALLSHKYRDGSKGVVLPSTLARITSKGQNTYRGRVVRQAVLPDQVDVIAKVRLVLVLVRLDISQDC